MLKRMDWKGAFAASTAVLLLSFVLAALPFSQKAVENELYIGFPVTMLTVHATAAGGFGVHLSIGAVILNHAIGYGVYWLIRKIALSAASARAARRAR